MLANTRWKKQKANTATVANPDFQRMKWSDSHGTSMVCLSPMKKTLMLTCLALAGCATGEKVTSLQPGMTKAQVIRTMGQPSGYSAAGNTETLQYTNKLISGWSWDKADYYAVLVNGRLTSWGSGQVRQNQPMQGVLVTGNITTTRF